MSILLIIAVVVLVGFLLYLAEKYVPMDPTIKRILEIVVVVVLVVWLLQVFGIWSAILGVKVGK